MAPSTCESKDYRQQPVHATHLSYVTAKAALNSLEEKGIAREITGKKKGRVYACTPILKAIFATDGEG